MFRSFRPEQSAKEDNCLSNAKRLEPRQQRSRQTELALIDTAFRLFEERGVDAVAMSDVALAAGVSPATINRRFGDKERLQKAVFRSFIDRAQAMVEATDPSSSANNLIDLLARISVLVLAFSRSHQGFLQSVYARALVDDHYAAGIRELRSGVLAKLRETLRGHAREIGHADPALAIEFVLNQAMTMLSARIDAERLEVSAIEEQIFLRELLCSITSYLKVAASIDRITDALAENGLGRS